MFDVPQVFVDIDTQRDFLDPAGALYVPGAVEIVPNLWRGCTGSRASTTSPSSPRPVPTRPTTPS